MRKRCKQSIPSATPLQITSPFPFLNHNSKQSQTDKIDREKAFNQFWVLQNSYPNPPSAWTCRLHFWLVLSLPWCILKPFNLAPERCYRSSRSRLRLRIHKNFYGPKNSSKMKYFQLKSGFTIVNLSNLKISNLQW